MVSPPMRGRGLKPVIGAAIGGFVSVAPHAGAWIETNSASVAALEKSVAPHAGAWIETRKST